MAGGSRLKRIVCGMVLVLLPSACADPATESTGVGAAGNGGGEGLAVVARVIDGDTIDVVVDGTEERVRLLGINTPESVDPERPVMCYGPEASAALKGLLPEGTTVRLERDVEPRDRFGRLLAYVHLPGGGQEVFVNLRLLEEGYANHFIKAPNEAYARPFRAAAAEARSAKRGLWGACPRPFEE